MGGGIVLPECYCAVQTFGSLIQPAKVDKGKATVEMYFMVSGMKRDGCVVTLECFFEAVQFFENDRSYGKCSMMFFVNCDNAIK